jgi:hypothetical protein
MSQYGQAWQHANEIAGLLPRNAVWSFCITNLEDDAVFNIYAPRSTWHALRVLLGLPRPEYLYDSTMPGQPSYAEFNIDGLVLSFITPEEHNDDGPDGPESGSDINAANARHGCGIPWIE